MPDVNVQQFNLPSSRLEDRAQFRLLVPKMDGVALTKTV
jgi:hypothetical protein